MVKKLKGKISNITNLSPTVKEFTINFKENLDFKAGQFVNLSFEIDGKETKKPYSITSSPLIQNQIKLCVKLIPEGNFTPELFKKNIGFEVNIMGPLGLFQCNPKKEKIVFIGCGTGISPLKSMILDLLENKYEKEIQLIFGVRNENEILYHDEFLKLQEQNPNFKYMPIISRPENWNARIGRVQENFDSIDPMTSEIYICGLRPMIEEAISKLILMGVSEKDIKTEKY